MLSEFEALVVALVGDRLAGRPALTVAQAGGAPGPLAAGAGLVQIGVSAAAPDSGFAVADRLPPITDPHVIRVVPLHGDVTATLIRRAAGPQDAALRAARRTLLEDLTVLLHALNDPDVRSGGSLRSSSPDPGFHVLDFGLDAVTVPPLPAGDQVQATVRYGCRVLVWPPGEAEEGKLTRAVDALVEALPLAIRVDPSIVPAGGSARVHISGVTGSRLADPTTGAREPVRVAVGVASQLPPADRGTVTGGTPAAVAGFRIFPVIEPETTVDYTAPAGPLGTMRSEEVVVHLAVLGEGAAPGVGVRLGSVTLGVRAAP